MRINCVQAEAWHPWIEPVSETIIHHLLYSPDSLTVGIEVYVAECTVRTQVVNTADMVVMGVGDKHSVDAPELLVHELLAYVGTTVYEQPGASSLYHGSSTQSAVVRVATLADLARTPERGHSARRSCTKEI